MLSSNKLNTGYSRIVFNLWNKRAAGIEPASSAWKAEVLPLHNARKRLTTIAGETFLLHRFNSIQQQKRFTGIVQSNHLIDVRVSLNQPS